MYCHFGLADEVFFLLTLLMTAVLCHFGHNQYFEDVNLDELVVCRWIQTTSAVPVYRLEDGVIELQSRMSKESLQTVAVLQHAGCRGRSVVAQCNALRRAMARICTMAGNDGYEGDIF